MPQTEKQTEIRAWQDELYDLLRRNGVSHFAYVPDAGNSRLIERSRADAEVTSVPLTTEEEGVALCAGVDLGGGRAALVIQSSGVGNCVNLFGLMKGAHFPMLMIVSMRGEYGETNPWQYPMGQAVEPVLAAMGFLRFRVEQPEGVAPAVQAAVNSAYVGGQAVAVILTQRLLGAKVL